MYVNIIGYQLSYIFHICIHISYVVIYIFHICIHTIMFLYNQYIKGLSGPFSPAGLPGDGLGLFRVQLVEAWGLLHTGPRDLQVGSPGSVNAQQKKHGGFHPEKWCLVVVCYVI